MTTCDDNSRRQFFKPDEAADEVGLNRVCGIPSIDPIVEDNESALQVILRVRKTHTPTPTMHFEARSDPGCRMDRNAHTAPAWKALR